MMTPKVDDWIETNRGMIGLVTDAGTVEADEVTVYDPIDQAPHVVAIKDILGAFPNLLH